MFKFVQTIETGLAFVDKVSVSKTVPMYLYSSTLSTAVAFIESFGETAEFRLKSMIMSFVFKALRSR